MRYAYTENLFVAYLKFKFDLAPCILKHFMYVIFFFLRSFRFMAKTGRRP